MQKMMPLTLLLVLVGGSVALENGLIRTPPMGWLHWQRFRCQIDCKNYPNDCISENLFMAMADHVAADGYKDAGYQYVNIDDCWLAPERDVNGRLQPDPNRFPHGMKALADYIHGKGLKFGIYEDIGVKTCGGYPGSQWYLQLDAQTFADWTIDYLKFDGCNYDPHGYSTGYPPMAFYLNMTGRPIALSCEYALYQRGSGVTPDYKGQAAACNVARNENDIDDSWDSLKSIIEFCGDNANDYASVAGPGFFNDPDMLLLGNYGLSYDQERTQMAIWCILAAPLFMSVDLRTINSQSKALLQNRGAIAVNQDPLGIQGKRVQKSGDFEMWTKPISPPGTYAFAFLNFANAMPGLVTAHLAVDLMFNNANGYNITEVFDGTYIGVFKPTDNLSVMVNPNGVFFGKAVPLP